MLARTALWASAGAMAISLLFGVLETMGIGLSVAVEHDDIGERILARFLAAEESYWLWGRWIDLSGGIGLGLLLVALPALPASAVARGTLLAGTTLALAGEAIDLSQLAGLEIARVGLDNKLTDVFAAGNAFRFAINTTSTFVWISGLFLLSTGLFVLGRDATDARWRLLCLIVAASLLVRGVTGPFGDEPTLGVVFKVASTVFVVAYVAWVATAVPRLETWHITSQ
jgi:hypothetical protein